MKQLLYFDSNFESKPSAKNFCFLSLYGFDGSRNIAIIKLLSFCCFGFDPKISTKCIYSVYHFILFLFTLAWSKNLVVRKKFLYCCLEIGIYPQDMMSFPSLQVQCLCYWRLIDTCSFSTASFPSMFIIFLFFLYCVSID